MQVADGSSSACCNAIHTASAKPSEKCSKNTKLMEGYLPSFIVFANSYKAMLLSSLGLDCDWVVVTEARLLELVS